MMEKMEKTLEDIPGVTTEFTQPVQMRFNELMTGVRSDVAIKIFGEDIDLLAGLAEQTVGLIQGIEGLEDARAEQVLGLPQITVRYNKDKLALYGLNVGDLNQVIRTGFAGEKAGVVYEGEKRFDLVVRLEKNNRQDISDLKAIYVTLPSGSQIPLEQVADIAFEPGPMQVSREDGKRRIVIGFNVRSRDVKSVVNEIQSILDAKLQMPPGYYITYGGQFQNLVEANKRLSIAVPVALALIFILLFFTFGSIPQSLLIFTAIPLSAIGGVFALWLRGMPFSISAGVGFIALFGVAVLNGIVLIGYFNQLKAEGISDVIERIKEGTRVRLRPVLMTAAVASLGFLPMAISTGAGAEVQKPLATVVIGGLITATLLTLVVLPILYYFLEKGFRRKIKSDLLVVMIAVLALFSVNVNAQDTQNLTLQQAIEIGTKNNSLLQSGALEVQVQEQLRGAAGLFPKTSINATLGQVNSSRFDQNFSISQEIPNPAALRARKNLAEQNIGLSQQRLNITRQEVVFNIRQSWYQILYFQAASETLQREDSLLRQFVRAATLKFKTGESNLLEKTTAETRQQQLQQEINQILVQTEAEKVRLRLWLNSATDVTIAETDFTTLPFAAIVDTALVQNNPSIRFAQQQIALAEAQLKATKAEALPDFSVGYVIQSFAGTQEVDGQPKTYNAVPRFQGVQVGITLPIFGKGYRSRNAAAATQVLAQRSNSQYLQTQIRSQLTQYAAQYSFWKNNVNYYRTTALPNAQSIITNATKAYQSGDIGYVEYAQALQLNLEIQRSYLEAINNFNQAVISIQFIINQ